MKYSKSLTYSTIAILLMTSLVGCGKKSEETKAGSQVIAKVNGQELSIHQLNFQMSRMGQLSEDQAKLVAKKVLTGLVDQELFAQKSIDAKLDRDPQVLQAMENSKREILAQAYLQRQLQNAKKPTDTEIADFYEKHPELFEKRRVFKLQELAVLATPDQLSAIEGYVASAKNIGDVATWLKSNNYQFSVNGSVRAAEQLSMDLLPKLMRMKDGEMIVLPEAKSINIILMAASEEQAYNREKATPIIEQYFLNQRKKEIAEQEVKRLRSEAKIEYLGPFADAKQDVAPEAQPAVPKADAATNNSDSDHMKKGLSGL